MEQLSSLRQDVGMIRAIVVPGKHVMSSLMLALKEAEVKALTIPVHINHFHKEKTTPKGNNETPTMMVHVGQINKTTTLTLPTEEEWSQATSEDHGIG